MSPQCSRKDAGRFPRAFASVLLVALYIPLSPVGVVNHASGAPDAPAVPVIVAVQRASLQVDRNSNGLADPGDTLRYTVTISNNGVTDAIDTDFVETLDSNTILTTDSPKVSPLATGDAYVVTQTQLTHIDAPGLLSNDDGIPPPWALAFSGPTSHGNVSISADGSFTYTPTPGYNGPDGFVYTVTNGIGYDTAGVSLTVDVIPAVVSTLPADGAIAVSASSVVITFNQMVSATASAFAMECPVGTPVALNAVPVLPGNASVFALAPQASLVPGVICQTTVAASQVRQAAGGSGRAMTANYVFTFHIPSCSDGVKNGSETDIDCGGVCGGCGDGKICAAAADCHSLVCAGGHCSAASCTDGVKNGNEADVDCGGSCPRCADGKTCSVGTDCQSLVCTSGHCSAASCTDGVKNGTEADIDCGGACPRCADGKTCSVGTDCQSLVCASGHCSAPLCSDHVKNGDETDVDCGGRCPPCANGKICNANIDCSSGHCTNHLCTVSLLRATITAESMLSVKMGSLPAGKSIIILFDTVIRAPLLPGATQVSNQGEVSGSNFASVLTDDPGTPDANDPTVIAINLLPPVVNNPTTSSLGSMTAATGGSVTSDGGSTITERGIVYAMRSVNSNPFIGGVGVTLMTTPGMTGVFTVSLTGLLPAVAYAYRAYAVNAVGTGFTVSRTFTTEKADSVTRLTTSANPAYFGRWVTFTMAVTSTATITPGGVVTFTLDNSVVPQLLNANGFAVYAANALLVGTHAITATYGGDTHFNRGNSVLPGGQVIIDLLKVYMPIVRR